MKLRPMNNYVLVKPKLDTNKIEVAGKEFYVDTTWEVEKHAPTEGEVIEVPDKLIFDIKKPWSTEFDVDMELKPKDKVYFHYLTKQNSESNGRVVRNDDGEILYLIPYDQIFAAVRQDKIIPINGYLLVDLIEGDLVKSEVLEIPDLLKKKGSAKFARVKHVSSPIRKYKRFPKEGDCNTVKVGDIVAYSINSDLPMQYAYYNSLGKEKKYRRMQRRDIFAIIPENIIDKFEFI